MFKIYEIKILLVCQVFMCHLYIYSLAFATVSYTWIHVRWRVLSLETVERAHQNSEYLAFSFLFEYSSLFFWCFIRYVT